MMKKLINCMGIMVAILLFQACSNESTKVDKHVVNIESQSISNTLFYTGTIQPLKASVITSPVDGVVVDMPFQYGERVKKGQLLFVLSSAKFLSDYKAALTQFVKTKSDFNTS